jgi:3-methyladenine DNA glycosylase Tag
MKRVKSTFVLFAIAASVCLLPANADIQAQTENQAESAAVKKECRNLAEFLKAEFQDNTKTAAGNSAVRLYGLQEKDATAKTLSLCAKLKAKKIESNGEYTVYELPDGLGTITVQEVFADGIFRKITFATVCDNLPFRELWLVTLQRYNQN